MGKYRDFVCFSLDSVIVDGSCRCKLSSRIHLSDLTRNMAGIEPAALRFRYSTLWYGMHVMLWCSMVWYMVYDIQGVLEKRPFKNQAIVVKHKILYSWEFKIASNRMKEHDCKINCQITN
jgi:hypothetical protein